ncbi:GNAT family N-acetyltransferase [Phenylobacterium deserti]|uniref:N-acetyltransferase n=1 Tax=Phenylobacterium deserti TaxID=1914756 RepID=A0A328AVR4_9CAUL|nr:GNAT family protein [Phenylobacterium deserti]RAK58261.1 N-acetyltransferase [Phenylobacterium deserti]
MKLEHRTLENRFVRLEPLVEAHREPLREACAADRDLWLQLYSFSMLDTAFDENFDKLIAGALAGPALSYAVIKDEACVGTTSLLRVDEANGALEIGGTYYRPEARGGAVNPAAKRLLFGHAFDGGMARVYLHVDALNARSRSAVLKLGAVQEGILRRDRIVWTGRPRDTVVFSVLEHEWPQVRDRLDARLADFA